MEDRTQRVERFQEDWAMAEQNGDTAFLKDALTNDFVGVGPRGFMLSKEEWLERHESGKLRYESLLLGETKVRLYGDSAIVIARQTVKGKYEEHDLEGRFRATLVLVERGGRWLLAGIHLSPVMGPPSG